MTASFIPRLVIPKDNTVLDFLQRLDGNSCQLKDAWIFLHSDVISALHAEMEKPTYDKDLCTLHLFNEVESRPLASVTYSQNSIKQWYLLHQVSRYDASACTLYHFELAAIPIATLFLMKKK